MIDRWWHFLVIVVIVTVGFFYLVIKLSQPDPVSLYKETIVAIGSGERLKTGWMFTHSFGNLGDCYTYGKKDTSPYWCVKTGSTLPEELTK